MDDADITQQNTEIYEAAAMQSRRFFQPVSGGRKWCECDDCGRPIPLARMEANPSASRCIKCQTKFERGRA
jgi:phage/conjugal plasmid C-4 type zinc finger TraR family protein